MTPQTLENDIDSEMIDLSKIVLIIYDEAHRATGNYGYANIGKKLAR